jgi:AraC-like DNA-binding protein
MSYKTIIPNRSISLFIKNILVFEETNNDRKTVLPFFADGYPGLMYQDTKNGLLVSPHNKQMPILFLYGQTIKPIELLIEGSYKLIIFQMYPFVLKSFFDITAKDLNDGCYDLQPVANGNSIIQLLSKEQKLKKRTEIISVFLFDIFQNKRENLDLQIRKAIQTIIDHKGQITIKDICSKIQITERTMERRFINEVGISAKQFSTIIQFQFSLEQLAKKEFKKLTDVVYNNGYTDQSHFIKVFKAFTGKTPKAFI